MAEIAARSWSKPLPPARTLARALLLLFAALTCWSLALGMEPPPPPGPPIPEESYDSTLYRVIAERVAAGEDYHVAAAAEQRARGFPLRPVVAVRPPVLASVTAWVGGTEAIGVVQRIAAIGVFLAFALRLTAIAPAGVARIAAMAAVALQCAIMSGGIFALLHDIWAGLLAGAAIMLWRPGRYAPALLCALAATCVREIAGPVMAAFALAAIIEGRRREALAWVAAIGVALAFLAWHWSAVVGVTLPGDGTSAGWLRARGWPWVANIYAETNMLSLLPRWLGYALVPAALIGWFAVDAPWRLRAGLWLAAMTGVFLLFGRPDNFYWGALVAPLLPVGVALAPVALARLVAQARAIG